MVVVMTRVLGTSECNDKWGLSALWGVVDQNGAINSGSSLPANAEWRRTSLLVVDGAQAFSQCASNSLPCPLAALGKAAKHAVAFMLHPGGSVGFKDSDIQNLMRDLTGEPLDLWTDRSCQYSFESKEPKGTIGLQLEKIAEAVRTIAASVGSPAPEAKRAVIGHVRILERAIENASAKVEQYKGLERYEQRTRELAYWLSFRGIRGKREELAKLILPFAFDVKTLMELDPDEHCRQAIAKAFHTAVGGDDGRPKFADALASIRDDIKKMVEAGLAVCVAKDKDEDDAMALGRKEIESKHVELHGLLDTGKVHGKTAMDQLAQIAKSESPSDQCFPRWTEMVLKASDKLVDAIDAVDAIPRKP